MLQPPLIAHATSTKEPLAIVATESLGIGALGRIEPRSRVIRVSHNAGAEGVKLLKLLFNEGDTVKQGQLLAVLADHDKRRADVNAAQARVAALEARQASEKVSTEFNEKELARQQALVDKALVSAAAVDAKQLAVRQSLAAIKQITAEIHSARAELQVAEQNLANTVINAPITGTIIKVHAWPGERLTDDGLLQMADLDQLDVVAEVYEADIARVKPGQIGEIRMLGIEQAYTATVRELGFQVRKNDLNDTDPLADRDNRIIEVRLTLEPKAVQTLQHQIYRQVQVRIQP